MTTNATMVTVFGTFVTTPKAGGTVFCVASTSNISSTSLSDVLVSPFSSPYTVFSDGFTVHISSLIPETIYYGRCVAQSNLADGEFNGFSSVEAFTFSTTCCKGLLLASLPSFVLNNQSAIAQEAILSQNQVVVSLQHAPSTNVTVMLEIQFDVQESNDQRPLASASSAYTLPSSILFTAQSPSFTGTFIVVVPEPQEGTLTMSLKLVGDSAMEYSVDSAGYAQNTMVEVSVLSQRPAPTMTKVVMDDAGTGATVVFDSTTNQMEMETGDEWSCELMLDFMGADVSQCVWVNASAVVIRFPSLASSVCVSVGGNVTLLSNRLRSSCESSSTSLCSSSFAARQSVVISAPLHVQLPVVVLSVPQLISSCTNVTLDARASLGHGGRAWSKVTWNVTDAVSGVSVLSIVNDNADVESTVIYLNSGLSYGTYIVTLSLTNHLLATSTVTKQFTWGSDEGNVYPSVVIVGNGVVQQTSSTRLQLQASVTLPRVSCAANLLNQLTLALMDVSFAWSIVDIASPSNPLSSLVSQSVDPLVFSLASYSLSAKRIYAVLFTVVGKHRESQALVSSETSVLVKISSGSLSARITGIASRAMLAQITQVRGDSSIDEDTSGTVHLQFSWSCRISSVPSNGFLALFGSICDDTVLSTKNQSTTTIYPLQLLTGYEYEISLTVTRPSDGTRSDTYVYVSRSPLLSNTSTVLPKIDLLTLPTFINTALTTEFPATLEVPVASSLRQTLQAEWTGRVGSTMLSLPTSLSTTTKNLTAVIRSTLNRQAATLTTPSVTVSFVFIAPPGTFAVGTNPTLTLTIRNVVSGVIVAFSTITVPVLSPPMNGILSVSPRNGSALETMFSLVTMRWSVVDPSSLPLTYAFAYQMSALSPTLLLQVRSIRSSVPAVFLPAGDGVNNQVPIVVTAYDVNMLTGTAETFCYVRQRVVIPSTNASETPGSQIDSSIDLPLVQSALSSATIEGDSSRALQLVNVVGTQLDTVSCDAAPRSMCMSLYRSPCSSIAAASIANTCGPCLNGYTGVSGYSNTMCMPMSVGLKNVGSACTSHTECQYGVCRNGTCFAPLQLCAGSQYVGQDYRTLQDCSGHGVCQYSLGPQLRLSQQCTVADVECYRRCECTVGYAGEDCSLSAAEASERDATRGALCTMLGEVITRSDAGENPDTFRSMTSTLNSLFRPSEVSTVQTLTLFANATSQLLTLLIRNPALFQVMTATAVSQGLNGTASTADSVPAVFVSLLSTFAGASFLEQAKLLSSNENEALVKQKLAAIGKVVSTATETFTTQLLSAMVPNQAPLRLGSDALQLVMVRNDLSSLVPAEYMALTLTNGAAKTEMDRPSMHLSYPASVALDNGEGQLLASLGYWTQSPFVLDRDMKSGLLRSQIVVSMSLGDESGPTHNATEHFLQIPFMTSQSLQTMESFLQSDAANVTLPVCSLVAGDGQEELACRGCKLSTYNNQSATFECATIDSLIAFSQFGTATSSRRSLQNVGYDDEGSSTTSVAQFGALLERVEASVVSILSFNPFHVNLEQSKGIVAFVGLLCFLLLGGGTFFYSWDAFDHAKMIYNNRNEELMTNDTALNRRMSTTMRPSMIDAECLIAADSFSPTKLPSSLRPASERWLGMTPQTPLAPLSFSSFTPAFISHVLDAAIPLAQIDPTARTWLQRQWDALVNNHEYFDAFGSPSLHESRFLRFLRTMQSILVMFFADTLFFGIFFPDQGTCEALQTETDCLLPMNKVTGQRLCVWDSTNYRYGRAQSVDIHCSLRSPPNDIVFTVLLSTMTLLVVLPIMLVLETIRIKVCRRQPDLTVPQRWLASIMSCFPSLLGPSVAVGKALVPDKGSTSQSQRQLQALSMTLSAPPIQFNGKEENKKDVEEEQVMKSSPTKMGTTARPMGDRAIDLLAPLCSSSSEDVFDADDSVNGSDSMTTDRIEAYFDELLARAAYADHASLQTEAAELLRQVREFFALATNNQPLPKDAARKQHYMLTRMAAKTMAIEHTLGLRTDGSDTSMAQVQSWLRYVGRQVNPCHNSSVAHAAASSSPQTLLEHRLHEARERTHHVEAMVTKASRAGLLEPDVALLQCFVLEQFSTFKQFILRYHFFDFPYAVTSTIHPVLWMMGWCIYVGFQFFAIYWIFAWCVYSGNSAFRGWGINGVLSIVQDVVLVQGLQVYLLFVAGIEALVPQLRAIYCRLYEVALRIDALQESGLLDEVRIVQFVSPSCRASRRQRLSRLNAAKILRCMDDIDVDYCRRQGRTPFSAVLMVVVALPGLVNIATHSFADFTLRLVLPSMVSFAFVGFYFAYSTSLILCVLLLIFVVSSSFLRSSAGDALFVQCGWRTRSSLWMASTAPSTATTTEAAAEAARTTTTTTTKDTTSAPLSRYELIVASVHALRKRSFPWYRRTWLWIQRIVACPLQCQQSSHTTRWQVMNNPFARDALAVPEEICLTEDANIYHQMVSFSPLKSAMSTMNAATSPCLNRHSLALSRMSLSNARSQQLLQLSLAQAPVVYRSHLMNINAHHMHSYERRVMAFDLKDAYRHIDGDVRTLEATSWTEKLHRLRIKEHHRSSKRSWRDRWQQHLGLRSRYRLVHRVPTTTSDNADAVSSNGPPLATQLPLFSSSNPVMLVSNELKLLRWDGVASRWPALHGETPSMKELMPFGTVSRRCGDDDATLPLVHEGGLGIASDASSVSWWNRPLPADDVHGLLTCSSHSLNENPAPLPPGDAAHSRRPSKQGSSSERQQEPTRRRHRRRRSSHDSGREYDAATIETSLAAGSCRSSGSDFRSYDAYEAEMTGKDNGGSDDGEDVRFRTLVSAAPLPALPPRRRRSSGGGSEHAAAASSSRRRTISSDVRSQTSTPSLSLMMLHSPNDSSYDTGSDVSSALSRVPSWSVPSMDSPAVGIASRRASDLLISDERSVVEGAAPPQAPPLVSRSMSLEFHLDHVYDNDAEFEASSPHGRHQEERRPPCSPSTPSLLRQKSSKLWEQSPDGRWRRIEPSTDSP